VALEKRADVEKDYVYSWILNELYSHSELASRLILKGGNACRKAYLPNTRFSKDLDFSIKDDAIDIDFLHDELNKICKAVNDNTGVRFELDKTLVKQKNVPIPNLNALEGRLYFKGFYGEESITLKAQLDVTQFDRVYLPIQTRPIIHPYSDADQLTSMIQCQKFEEIIASKLDTLLHRRKATDMFDLMYSTLFNTDYSINRREIVTTFLKKTIYEPSPNIVKQQLNEVPLEEYRPIWTSVIAPTKSLFDFEQVLKNFHNLIGELFALVPVTVSGGSFGSFAFGVGTYGGGFAGISYFPTNLRNAIIDGGKNQTLVEISYDGYTRLVEPYSIEYKIRENDNQGLEYFWGFDRTGGKSGKQGIKKFICDKIVSAKPTSKSFTPQWPIEL
jgi:predicted nucleotidyltransferase component of viral defense system